MTEVSFEETKRCVPRHKFASNMTTFAQDAVAAMQTLAVFVESVPLIGPIVDILTKLKTLSDTAQKNKANLCKGFQMVR